MARPRKTSPTFCKWFIDDWLASTMRQDHLTSISQRGIYHELWGICMSSPRPGSAVDRGGKPRTLKALARQIGCREDHLKAVVRALEDQGQARFGTEEGLIWNEKLTAKSLPDHWKYRRGVGVTSDKTPNSPVPEAETEAEAEKEPPISPTEVPDIQDIQLPHAGDDPKWTQKQLEAVGAIRTVYCQWEASRGVGPTEASLPTSWPAKILATYKARGATFIQKVTSTVLSGAYAESEGGRFWGWGKVEQFLDSDGYRRRRNPNRPSAPPPQQETPAEKHARLVAVQHSSGVAPQGDKE